MQSLPGFRDFLPDDCARRNYIFARWRAIARRYGFIEKDFVVRISDREFWTDFFRDKNVPGERWDDLLQAIDKSAREPREKTAEKLGDLADPVFAALKSGGKSAKLEQLVDGLRAR